MKMNKDINILENKLTNLLFNSMILNFQQIKTIRFLDIQIFKGLLKNCTRISF